MLIPRKKKEALNYVQSLYYPILNELISDFTLPVQKFIRQVVYCILKSRSVIGQQIAKSLEESIKLCKTCDRIYRNLQKDFLHSDLMLKHMQNSSADIKEDTPIFIDFSDINKSTARKMEGLHHVWYRSQHQKNPGYLTLQATYCDPENPKKISLYYSELFSLE